MKRRGSSPHPLLFAVIILTMASLPACVTRMDPSITSVVASHHVSAQTARKIQSGQILNYRDIQNLVRAKVPTHIIIAYLQSTERSYQFTRGQLSSLKGQGASPQLINYLNESKGFYTNSVSPRSAAPFSFPWMFKRPSPAARDMIDPAYEESLYSPFLL